MWENTPQSQRDLYERRVLAESNKMKIMNKSTIQAVIRSGDFFSLTVRFTFFKVLKLYLNLKADEARENLNDEQQKLYKKQNAEMKKQLQESLEV